MEFSACTVASAQTAVVPLCKTYWMQQRNWLNLLSQAAWSNKGMVNDFC